MRYIICILFGFFLVSCSGTGMKNISGVNSMIMNSKGQLFVGREPGYYGSAVTYRILLNGKELGALGAGETLIGELIPGLNTVKATGTLSDLASETISFDATKGSNKFIIVELKRGLLIASFRLYEVTESAFKHSMQK